VYVTEIALVIFVTMVYLAVNLLTRPKHPETAPLSPHHDCPNKFELLETKFKGLQSDQRKLTGEWVDYHSRLDTVIRRGIRLGVLEQKAESDNDEPVVEVVGGPSFAESRSKLLSEFRRRENARKSNSE